MSSFEENIESGKIESNLREVYSTLYSYLLYDY